MTEQFTVTLTLTDDQLFYLGRALSSAAATAHEKGNKPRAEKTGAILDQFLRAVATDGHAHGSLIRDIMEGA